ncbi:uncharacterized protein LOC124595619 [Schistocerca americana]|uniref:uncharacterized protein LOC124595619 n=1 Tax=Schistocerca americana TaxID=7009 RepID=UPI001F501A6A|nr:uncharacterized protein LOC124595619 [Schistocerca americana]
MSISPVAPSFRCVMKNNARDRRLNTCRSVDVQRATQITQRPAPRIFNGYDYRQTRLITSTATHINKGNNATRQDGRHAAAEASSAERELAACRCLHATLGAPDGRWSGSVPPHTEKDSRTGKCTRLSQMGTWAHRGCKKSPLLTATNQALHLQRDKLLHVSELLERR